MCIRSNCPYFYEAPLIGFKNEKGKIEFKYNPNVKCFDNVLLHEKGIKKSLCKHHFWMGEAKFGYCRGAFDDKGKQLSFVRKGFEYTPLGYP
jgi:hypothetical protein